MPITEKQIYDPTGRSKFYVSQELKDAIARQLGTSQTLIDQAIQSLEETGNFPQNMATLGRSLNQYFPSGNWKNEVQTISELQKQDKSNLADKELQSQQDFIEKVKGQDATQPRGLNESGLTSHVKNIFLKYSNNTGVLLDKNTAIVVDSLKSTGKLPDVKKLIGYTPANQSVLNHLQEGDILGEFSYPPVSGISTEDVNRITAIQSDRANVKSQEAEVTRLEQSIPEMLAQNRKAFYGQQREQAKDYITGQYAPQIAESLGARGLSDSGEVGATVASQYGDIQRSIDQHQLQQQNEEFNFWANQAYQATFDKLIQARTNVAGEVANVQQTALQTSSRNFSKAQTAIQDKFNLDLWRQENARALNAYEKQNQAKQDALKRGQEAELVSALGGAAAATAGYAAFGSAGGIVGSELGRAAGSAGSRFLG